MRTHYNKPRLTSDGLTLVAPYHNARGAADQRVADLFAMIAAHTLTEHTHIHQWQPAQYWEFRYITRAQGGRTHRQRWDDFCKIREDRAGWFTLSGNFEEYSYGFSIMTKDLALVAKFAKAMMANAGWPAIMAYHLEGVGKFAKMRKAWGTEYVEPAVQN